MASILDILTEMEALLRKDRVPIAALLAEIATIENPAEFAAKVTGLEIWGGAGAVIDVTLRNPRDDRRFNERIVDLAEALESMGLSTPRTRWVGQIVEDWLIAHPI